MSHHHDRNGIVDRCIEWLKNWAPWSTQSALEEISPMELEQQKVKIDQNLDSYKSKMADCRNEFQQKFEDAEEADRLEIEELKIEASHIVDMYEMLRYERNYNMAIKKWLMQVQLGKRKATDLPNPMEALGLSTEDIPNIATEIQKKREEIHDQALGAERGSRILGDATDEHNDQLQSSLVNEEIDEAFEAVQQDGHIPSVDELIEDRSTAESSEGEREIDEDFDDFDDFLSE